MTARAGGRGFVRDNGLGLSFTVAFLLALVGQAIAGHADFNNQMAADQLQQISLGEYVTTSDFAVDVSENCQSEYLQFFLYIGVTVWLVQRGSPESKQLHKAGTESDEDQLVGEHVREDSPRWARAGGWRRAVYSRHGQTLGPADFDDAFTTRPSGGKPSAVRVRPLQCPAAVAGDVLAGEVQQLLVATGGGGGRRCWPGPLRWGSRLRRPGCRGECRRR
ncbi:DUF6766 family protein [Streptomyces mirabilis]|uniref:DUF6766 family protein n=1 Tax=Streptomyces mirabilis TaxID=68239 RepID=UPI0036B18DCC